MVFTCVRKETGTEYAVKFLPDGKAARNEARCHAIASRLPATAAHIAGCVGFDLFLDQFSRMLCLTYFWTSSHACSAIFGPVLTHAQLASVLIRC